MITLAPLSRDDLDAVRGLRPLPEQEPFSGTGAQIASDPREAIDFHGIFDGDRLVGVFKIDRAYEDGQSFADPGAWGLRGMLIDAGAQGKGVGKSAFAKLPGYLRGQYPDLDSLWLTVNCKNPAARHVYLRGGWEDTGELYHGGRAGPQHILRLSLP